MGIPEYVRMASLLSIFALTAGACTGTAIDRTGSPSIVGLSESAADDGAAGDASGSPSDPAGTATTPPATGTPTGDAGGDTSAPSPTDGSAPTPADATASQATDESAAPATPRSTDTPSDTASNSPGTRAPDDGATSPGPTAPPGPPEASLYDDRSKTIGITDDRIHLCGHAALIFADAFDVRPEDLNTYWTMVNDAGGIHGRSVTATWKDDAYSPDSAVQAAQSCKAEDPFFLIGGIGFDQIPAVRNWAEANQMLYLHHIAAAPNGVRDYSFSYQPTVDEVGRAFGEHIAATYGSEQVGIVWRQSENWEPGHRTGRAQLDEGGVNVVADLPVQKSQGVYSQQIFELSSQGAEVVWLWENALAAAQFIQQAYDQGYRPTWIVFPFQTTLDVIGDRALSPPMDGVATWPAYARGGYGGAYAEHGLDAEIARFEAAYAEYRPDTQPNDLLWQVWVGNKTLHDTLERCGPDCNRNRLAGLWLSGLETRVNPGCTVDFGRPGSFGGHIGGFQFLSHQTFDTSSGPQWKNTSWCRDHLS